MKNNFTKYSDEQLIEMLRGTSQESEAAFTEVYNRYASKVHAYCFRLFNNQQLAEDMFQETFIRFFEKVKNDYHHTNIPGYLITIARNMCLNYKRDAQQMVPIDAEEFFMDSNILLSSNENMDYENSELLNLITSSLELLEFDFKEAFVLREYNGMSYDEIADISGTSVANAKSRVFRAKQKIKEILNPYLMDLSR